MPDRWPTARISLRFVVARSAELGPRHSYGDYRRETSPNEPAEARAIDQRSAITILEALHRYAETGAGHVKPLTGEFEDLLRLRVSSHRVFLEETETTVTCAVFATAMGHYSEDANA